MWLALLTIPLFLLAGIGLLNDANVVFHYLMVVLAGGALSVAIFVALELDLPFHEIDALPPTPIATAIDQALK